MAGYPVSGHLDIRYPALRLFRSQAKSASRISLVVSSVVDPDPCWIRVGSVFRSFVDQDPDQHL